MGLDISTIDWQRLVLFMGILIIAITVHEFAHAFAADKLGDPTPRSQGRISLFPTDHLDPFGTVMMLISSITGFGIGWGKPVMTNPRNFKNPRRDGAIVAVAGPISNLIQATVFSVLIRLFLSGASEPVAMFLKMGLVINLSLAFFNMIPIAPLDGHWIMGAILPRELGYRYMTFMHQYGMFIFLGIVLMAPNLISMIIGPPVEFCASLLLAGYVRT